MVKYHVRFCNNSLGGNAWHYLALFYDIILAVDHVSFTLDGVTLFLHVINVRNTCKHLRYSQTRHSQVPTFFLISRHVSDQSYVIAPLISSSEMYICSRFWCNVLCSIKVQIWKENSSFLCVRIEIDQLWCMNCWVIIHRLSVSWKQINHSCFALVI